MKKKYLLGAAGAAVALLLILALGLGWGRAARTITVTGTGKVNVTPDLAYVTVGVDKRAGTPDAAVADDARVVNKVVAAVTGFGVKKADLQTSGYNFIPYYNYPSGGGPGTIGGFEVTQTVRVKVEKIGILGKLVAAAVDAGANQVQGVNFDIKDRNSLWQKAMGLAMDDARSKAAAMAGKMGALLGRPLNVVVVSSNGSSLPLGAGNMQMQTAMPSAYPVFNPGTGKVEVQVVVSFAY